MTIDDFQKGLEFLADRQPPKSDPYATTIDSLQSTVDRLQFQQRDLTATILRLQLAIVDLENRRAAA